MSRALSTVLRPVVVPITHSGSPVRKEPSKFRQLHTRVCYSWFFKKRRSTYVKASGLRLKQGVPKVYGCSTLFDMRSHMSPAIAVTPNRHCPLKQVTNKIYGIAYSIPNISDN